MKFFHRTAEYISTHTYVILTFIAVRALLGDLPAIHHTIRPL